MFGAVLSTLDEDDKGNYCGDGKHPLLKELHAILKPSGSTMAAIARYMGDDSHIPTAETTTNTLPVNTIRSTVSCNANDTVNIQYYIQILIANELIGFGLFIIE